MEVVVTAGAISRAKLQSNHHHQHEQTNIHFLFTGRMPFMSPTNSVKALNYHLLNCVNINSVLEHGST